MNFERVLPFGIDQRAVSCRGPWETVSLVEKQNGMQVDLDTEEWRVTAVDMQSNCHLGIITGRDWSKLCDYLLVCESADRVEVVLVELKRKLTPTHEENASEQLRRSLPVWRYLSSACAVQEEADDCPGVPVRYAAIYSRADERLAKQRPRNKGRGWTTIRHGIRVHGILADSVRLSELDGSVDAGGATVG